MDTFLVYQVQISVYRGQCSQHIPIITYFGLNVQSPSVKFNNYTQNLPKAFLSLDAYLHSAILVLISFGDFVL